ncbi:MAG: dihydroorotase [Acutalibacteraceae bacterium]|nr:dihydroorotase [Acutalibacteraceae bacterium]
MDFTFKNAHIYNNGGFEIKDFTAKVNDTDPSAGILSAFNNICVFPTFCDVHVHFREPGFFYKETIRTGSLSAARGGYTDVCTMPNLNPVPDSVDNIRKQLDIIEKTAAIRVHPYAAITKGEMGQELVDFEALAPYCIAFSDDGRGVQSEDMMRSAMLKAKELGKIIAAHCEDNTLLNGGYIHKGEYAEKHGHKGISSESEWRQIERDLRLAKETGCKYHVCHISTAESVELIRKAKAEGVDVTCETGPHYLVLSDKDLEEDGRFKMNPPLRSEGDRLALIEGIKDGTIDMIATDHAPHSQDEKSKGLEKSLMGVVGLETAFPVLYTYLVKEGIISLEKLIELMSVNPRKRFGIKETEDVCVFALDREYTVDPDEFMTMGRSTPFAGYKVFGKNLITVCGGKTVWQIK